MSEGAEHIAHIARRSAIHIADQLPEECSEDLLIVWLTSFWLSAFELAMRMVVRESGRARTCVEWFDSILDQSEPLEIREAKAIEIAGRIFE